MKKRIQFAKESFPYIIVLVILSILLNLISSILSLISLLLMLFVLFFFRDPARKIPEDNNTIVSPADGKIINIEKIENDDFLKTSGIKVSIFLSIFDVHINRSPINGTVKYLKHVPGQYLAAYHKNAEKENERNYLGIENKKIKVMVIQIAGLVARRIVCNFDVNDKIGLGEKFGLIKFGSCTQIIVPESVEIFVNEGDRVKGGETILGRFD